MRKAIILLVVMAIAGTAIAQDLGNSRERTLKNTPIVIYTPPAEVMQGGDTIYNATVIPGLPYTDSGITCGYINDYDETCPYTGSTSPDVVYTFTPGSDIEVDIDLCGSDYDTKLYVYGADLALVACNEDFYFDEVCGVYVSRIENAPLMAGETYFIVIDGYGGDCGEYTMEVVNYICNCYVGPCPPGSVLEGEPEIMDGYQDAYNGGCNSPEYGNPFQSLEAFEPGGHLTFCGKSGWYDDGVRDTDWFTVILDPEGAGVLECRLCGEFGTYLFQLDLPNCDQVGVIQSALSQWQWAEMTIVGAPGDVVWLWVGSATFYPPSGYSDHEYGYYLEIDGLQGPVATEQRSWSQVKSLFR